MTNLINQISINGTTNTFYGYVNPINDHGLVNWYSPTTNILSTFLDTAIGSEGTNWRFRTDSVTDYLFYAFRFPVPWETLSGTMGTTWYPSNSRCMISLTGPSYALNSTTTTGSLWNQNGTTAGNNRTAWNGIQVFAVANMYSFCVAAFSDLARTSLVGFSYVGWAKNSPFLGGGSFPSALIHLKQFGDSQVRYFASNVNQSVTISTSNIVDGSPTLSCQTPTAGADSSQLVIQRTTSPQWYLGEPYNILRLPSTAVVGKIYKNTGIDPDTGQVETDQKAYWMCVGTWGTDKIGMRVWTENIT
jgi:hypothetical protein